MLERLLKGVIRIESLVATISYGAVAALLIIDIVGREVLGVTFLGLQQLAVYGAIIAGFLGLTLATSDNCHLRPAFLDFLSGPRYDAAFARLGDLLSGLFFIGAAVVALKFVQVSMELKDRAPVLYFVLWPLQTIIPYAFASAAVKHLIFAVAPILKPSPKAANR